MLQQRTVTDRLSFWEFLAVKQFRSDNDRQRLARKRELVDQKRDQQVGSSLCIPSGQRRLFDQGLMGYGAGMYSLILTNRKESGESAAGADPPFRL